MRKTICYHLYKQTKDIGWVMKMLRHGSEGVMPFICKNNRFDLIQQSINVNYMIDFIWLYSIIFSSLDIRRIKQQLAGRLINYC